MLAGTANPGFYSSRAMPGSAGTKRTSTSALRSKPASVLVDADQRLDALMRPDRRDQDAARLEPLPAASRDFLHRRGHDDAVEIPGTRRDVEAVAEHHLDIVVAELFEPGAGACRPASGSARWSGRARHSRDRIAA